MTKDTQQKLTFSILFAACLLFIIPFSSAINDSILYYSFEDMPSITTNDLSGEERDGNLTSAIIADTFSKVGDWAIYADTNNYIIGSTNISKSANSSLYLTQPRTYSFWFYPSNLNDRTEVFVDGANKTNAANALIWVNYDPDDGGVAGNGSFVVRTYDHQNSANRLFTMDADSIQSNSWNHIILYLNQTGAGVGLRQYTNNEYKGATVVSTTGTYTGTSYANSNSQWLLIGQTNQTNPSGATEQPFYIDEFAIYNRSLTRSEVEQLYNSGYGFNPYNTTAPQQIASIASISLTTQSQTDIDYGAFFVGETNISINYSYGAATYESYFGVPSDAGDFETLFLTTTTVRYYSKSAQVAQTPITISACNSGGCTNVTTYLTISGFGVPTQLASIADWTITDAVTESRVFSDYFAGYTRRFFQYTDPDDGVTLVNVTNGFSDNNSCFNAVVVGDTLQVTGINDNGCSVTTRMIVDDTVTSVTSADFTTIITPISAVQGSGLLGYFSGFLNGFPNASDASTTTKTLIVMTFIIGSIIAGLWIIKEGGNPTVTSAMTGVAVLFEIIFFTSISYIPLWIIVIIVGIVGLGYVSKISGIFGRGY